MSSSCTTAASKRPGSPAHLQNESKLYRHLLYIEFNEFATGEIEAGQMNHDEALRKTAASVSAAPSSGEVARRHDR